MKHNNNIEIVSSDFDQKIWNSTTIHPLQSWQWGEARRQMGIEVLRFAEYSNKQIINVYQLTFHKIPYTNYKIGYLPRSISPSKKVLELLQNYGKKNKVIFIKLEPYVILSEAKNLVNRVNVKKDNNASLDSSVASLLQNDKTLLKSPHPLFPEWTQILDLTKSEEELLKNMHPKTRYNIRLAQKKGVTFKEISNDESFEIFAKLYFETCKRQKYFGHNYQYHKIVWENMKNNVSHIIIAFYQDIPLAAYQLFCFKDTIYYVYGGTSDKLRNLMASNLLMWEAILLGKKLGAKKLDMWGSLPPNYDPNNPWAGFTRFKEGYGGNFVEFVGSFDLVINPMAYNLYNYAFNLRNFYLRLKRFL